MIDKVARKAGPARRAALLVALSGLLVAADATTGTAQGEPADGRDPGAVPGESVDTTSAPRAQSDGRTGEIVLMAPTSRSFSVAADRNGRGGPDPAVGPNLVEQADEFVAAEVVVAEVGEIDTDSGAPQVASRSAANPRAEVRPVDEDIPGISRRVRPPVRVVDLGPVDRDG